jgi:hypothetical protein
MFLEFSSWLFSFSSTRFLKVGHTGHTSKAQTVFSSLECWNYEVRILFEEWMYVRFFSVSVFSSLVAAFWHADPACKKACQLYFSLKLYPGRGGPLHSSKEEKGSKKLNNYCVYVTLHHSWRWLHDLYCRRSGLRSVLMQFFLSKWRYKLLSNEVFSCRNKYSLWVRL